MKSYLTNCLIFVPESIEDPLFTQVTANQVCWPSGDVSTQQDLVVCSLNNMAVLPLAEYRRLKELAGEITDEKGNDVSTMQRL